MSRGMKSVSWAAGQAAEEKLEPWSFWEEFAAGKYMAQLQHNTPRWPP
jgi:hypothetical protein